MNSKKHQSTDPSVFRSAFADQQELVERNHPAACQPADELRAETEKRAGAPVRIRYLDAAAMLGGSDVQLAECPSNTKN